MKREAEDFCYKGFKSETLQEDLLQDFLWRKSDEKLGEKSFCFVLSSIVKIKAGKWKMIRLMYNMERAGGWGNYKIHAHKQQSYIHKK